MASPEELKKSQQELELLNQLGADLKVTFLDIESAIRNASKENKNFANEFKTSADLSRDLSKSAQELAGFTAEQLYNEKEVKKFRQKNLELTKKRATLDAQIFNLRVKLNNAGKNEVDLIKKVLENLQNEKEAVNSIQRGFEDVLATQKDIEKSDPFKGISDLIGEIPVLNKVFPEFKKASETYRKNMSEGASKTKAAAKAAEQLSAVVAKLTLGFLISGLKDFDERTVSVGRNLNRSRTESDALVKNANAFAKANKIAGVTGQDITNSQIAFSNALGTSATLSNETAANFSNLQTKLGLSVEQATEFTKLNIASGKDSREQTQNLIGQVQVLNAQNDSAIKYQDVLKDITGASKATLLSIQGQGKSLAQAAFEARKMGMSLNQMEGIAGNLLDFESSIAAELEAELLTGKELNLEKARQAALDGDMATLSAEIAKNVGSAEEFGKMNRIQQEAVAKALGMQREDLAKALVEQEALKNMGVESTEDLNAKVKLQLKEIENIKDAEEREAARAALITKLGSDELVQQEENRTLRERQAELSKKMLSAFDKFSPLLEKIAGIMEIMVNHIDTIFKAMMLITGANILGKFKSMGKIFDKMKNASSAMSKNVTTATMKATGKQVSGAAAQSAVKAGTATATGVKQGGGLFGGLMKKATNFASGVSNTLGKLNPMNAIKKFLGSASGLGKLLKRIPILGSIIGGAIAISETKSAAGSGADAQEVGKSTLKALGGLGGGIIGGILGSLIPVPGVGTILGGIAGDALGRWVAGLIADNMDVSKIGQLAIDTFGGEKGGDTAADFISRPGQPIQKFRKDDIIIGGTSLGGGGDGEVVTLLKELVAAVKTGGDVYMDSTKVGTALTVGSYKLQ